MNNHPLVSIMMNCRNSQEYLSEAIDSVFAQSYANWEIIFWDNASTDDSAKIAKSYGEKVRYFRGETAIALGQARNLALAEVKGEYLSFLDCDDKWLSQKLQKQVELLEARKNIDFVYSNYFRLVMPKVDSLILGLRGSQPEGDVFGPFLYNYPVNLQTVMLRMDTVNRLEEKFDDRFEVSEEFDFFMRILFKSKAFYIDEPLAIYRIHQDMRSQKLLYKYPVEMGEILNKLKNIDSLVLQKYAQHFKYYEAKLGYWDARTEMERNNPRSARSKLSPYKFTELKFGILYLLTFFPPAVWKWLHRYKLEGKLH